MESRGRGIQTWRSRQSGVDIETDFGAVLTYLADGIIFGAAGYFGANWVADHIDKN